MQLTTVCKPERMKCWQDAFTEGAPGCEQKCCPRLERHDCRGCSGASSGRKEPGCNLSRCSQWKSKIWRIYLFLAAKAARLIFPSVDGFSGCATGSLKLVQISAACPASNFSEFPAANSPLLLAVAGCFQPFRLNWTPLLACRAPKQTTSLYWTSEPQLNPTLWFGHCAPNAYSLFWLCRGWMNSTVESEHAQPLPFQSCGLRKKKKKEQHLRVRGIITFPDIFFLENTETNLKAVPAVVISFGANLLHVAERKIRTNYF